MKAKIFFWSLTSALAGFLFGFDTVVISGADQKLQALWHLSAVTHGIVMAVALYGTVIGSILGGWPTDKFGRKSLFKTNGTNSDGFKENQKHMHKEEHYHKNYKGTFG